MLYRLKPATTPLLCCARPRPTCDSASDVGYALYALQGHSEFPGAAIPSASVSHGDTGYMWSLECHGGRQRPRLRCCDRVTMVTSDGTRPGRHACMRRGLCIVASHNETRFVRPHRTSGVTHRPILLCTGPVTHATCRSSCSLCIDWVHCPRSPPTGGAGTAGRASPDRADGDLGLADGGNGLRGH